MPFRFYNPFENLHLNDSTCFLTGVDIIHPDENITVFPAWILDRFLLRDQKFKMIDQVTSVLYGDLKLPCSAKVAKAFNDLEFKIQEAFNNGYDGVQSISSENLFLWMSKIVYGVLYHDLLLEKTRLQKQDKVFRLSSRLKERLGLFHLMLQSLVSPVTFKGLEPWSISVVRLKYSKDIFNYRDDPVNLIFSLGMNGFGLIACLQDSGLVKQTQKEILDKINDAVLHPVQFEELCARFFYSNYLLHYQPKYNIEKNNAGITIETLPVAADAGKPLFGKWDDSIFAQVLTEHWRPWGFTKKDIITVPNDPISFLKNDYTHEFIAPDSIHLPY